jgi:hypothetical protein
MSDILRQKRKILRQKILRQKRKILRQKILRQKRKILRQKRKILRYGCTEERRGVDTALSSRSFHRMWPKARH